MRQFGPPRPLMLQPQLAVQQSRVSIAALVLPRRLLLLPLRLPSLPLRPLRQAPRHLLEVAAEAAAVVERRLSARLLCEVHWQPQRG